MQRFKFHRGESGVFGEQHTRLVYDQYSLLPFINRVFSEENTFKVAHERSDVDRITLQNVLKSQYEGLKISPAVESAIESLSAPNTYTITTGHQLSVFTGPLYFVIKILHVIKLSKELNEKQGDIRFVPVFWMASEDHDFEEIATVSLFNQKLVWESEQKGAVGRFHIDAEFERLKAQFGDLFKTDHVEISELLKAYSGKTLAEATRGLVNELFGDHGLIVIDADNKDLKRKFLPLIEKELKTSFAEKAVEQMNLELTREGIDHQLKARDINLFYLDDQARIGIKRTEKGVSIPGVGEFDLETIIEVAREHPERFSPNVVLRPVYQETILPNVLYVGGGGEIAYWLQLKEVFKEAGIPYPLIQVRNSVMWIDAVTEKRIAKLDLALESLFRPENEIKNSYLQRHESEVLDDENIQNALKVLKDEILDFVVSVDKELERYAMAEGAKLDKQIQAITSKVVRAAKSKHDDAMNGISAIKTRLFPENELQERVVNFFQFCAAGNVEERLGQLYHFLDPFENDLIVIRES